MKRTPRSRDLEAIIADVSQKFIAALGEASLQAYRREVAGGMPEGYPPELELIALTIAEAVELKHGTDRHEALGLGLFVAEKVRANFGGSQIYIPMRGGEKEAILCRVHSLLKSGKKPAEIAQITGHGVGWVYRAIKESRRAGRGDE